MEAHQEDEEDFQAVAVIADRLVVVAAAVVDSLAVDVDRTSWATSAGRIMYHIGISYKIDKQRLRLRFFGVIKLSTASKATNKPV